MKKSEDLIDRYIWVDANRCHGKPCFKGTRIMIWQILEMLEYKANIEQIQDAFPNLTPKHVTAALHYAARVLEEREFDPSFLKERDVVSA